MQKNRKCDFFFMWTIFSVFIEFVTLLLLLFYGFLATKNEEC